jgi:hypothetical protein
MREYGKAESDVTQRSQVSLGSLFYILGFAWTAWKSAYFGSRRWTLYFGVVRFGTGAL